MDKLGAAREASAGGDLTANFRESGSWMDSSSIRRRRLSAPSASAFLTPAFDACAAATPLHTSSSSSGASIDGLSLDIDASLLRYTRSGPYLPYSVTDSSDHRSASSRRRLQRILYLRSSMSPLSPIENLQRPKSSPMHMTPVKLEVGEDVVVMDGLLVSDAGSATGRNLSKTQVCRAWDENGVCRYGSKCQFAHGKEEVRSNHPLRHKSELSVRRPHWNRSPFCLTPEAVETFSASVGRTTRGVASSPSAMITPLAAEADCKKLGLNGISTPISLAPRIPDQGAEAAEATEGTTSNISPHPIKTLLAADTDNNQLNSLSSPISTMPSFQWPLTEAEDAQAAQTLHGPSQCRRLPVFTQLCSEQLLEILCLATYCCRQLVETVLQRIVADY